MIKVDVLVVGQGICGTFFSRELDRVGLSYLIIDDEQPSTASRAAAGLINPVTGRRMVKTWLIDELLPFVREAYGEWLRPVRVVDFFPTPQMRLAFVKRCEEGAEHLRLPRREEEHGWDELFRYELGYGVIEPCYLVDVQGLLRRARAELRGRGVLREERLMAEELTVRNDGVQYREMQARWVIFCDGVAGAREGYFTRLPFAPNKGEALIVEAPGLEKATDVFKRGISLAPWKDGLFWVGSSYEWEFDDPGPTAAFRERTEAVLRDWLRLPFRTMEHFAAVRPATLERRPFVGLHPGYPAVGILNGMGTKGCSLAPFFARQLAELLISGTAVRPDADVARFRRVLGRG
ncbi:MAG TPA: FAD-dependent oxidoreductase [Puia sp.]|jgi:glycine/D-amino acid oxidase-like deaminating enzyme|nr:FAD-dependent oxidoreductase [Puia sp.]